MVILIVEDEKKMAEALRKGLEAENHKVTAVYDGSAALEFASALESDVVVLDLMLPGIDGFEVARRLRKTQDETPITEAQHKSTARKDLEKQLNAAVRAALENVGSAGNSPSIPAILAIENQQPNRVIALRRNLDDVLKRLDNLDPKKYRDGRNR